MEGGFWVVIGMTLAYAASFLGMIFAYISYRRRKKGAAEDSRPVEEGKE